MSAVPETDFTDEDLELLAPRRARVVRFRGEDIEITPLTVRQLADFAPHARPLVQAVNDSLSGVELSKEGLAEAINLTAILGLIESHTDNVLSAASAATGKPKDWLGDGTPDEFLELVTAVVAVNIDFFARRLLPAIARNVSVVYTLIGSSGGGPTPSSSSSSTDTP